VRLAGQGLQQGAHGARAGSAGKTEKQKKDEDTEYGLANGPAGAAL
jgi:hypothetical protein